TGAVLKSLTHPDEIWALAWSSNGRMLAAGCNDQNVHVWDASDWHKQSVLEGHHRRVLGVAFSPTGELLASSYGDGTTLLWDPISGPLVARVPGKCAGFDRRGRRLAFQQGLQVGIWEVATGRECCQLRYGRVGNRMHSIATGAADMDFGWGGNLLAA